MKDIEKEMYHRVVEITPEGNSKEFKSAAYACYEIHRREIDKLKQELTESVLLVRKVNTDKFKRIMEIIMEEPPTFEEAKEKFKG